MVIARYSTLPRRYSGAVRRSAIFDAQEPTEKTRTRYRTSHRSRSVGSHARCRDFIGRRETTVTSMGRSLLLKSCELGRERRHPEKLKLIELLRVQNRGGIAVVK
jgi:hypothetical protein